MKTAVIPEKKSHEARSLVTHNRQPKRTTVDVVELAAEVEAMAESIEQGQRYVSENVYSNPIVMRWCLARVEIALEHAGVNPDSLDRVDAKNAELLQ